MFLLAHKVNLAQGKPVVGHYMSLAAMPVQMLGARELIGREIGSEQPRLGGDEHGPLVLR